MEGKIHVDIVKEHIGTVTIDHPPVNDLPGYLLSELARAIRDLGDEEVVKVILLKSAGNRVFCAGASFDEMASIRDDQAGKDFFMGFAEVMLALRDCGKITVGRIHGKVVGGGVGLCSAVDYAVANQWASVRLSELDLGIGPFVIEPAVTRKMGISFFSALSLSPQEWKSASWGVACGLFHALFEDTDEMDDYLEAFLDQFASYSPGALSEMKKMLWQDAPDWDDLMRARAEISGRLVMTNHAQQRIREELRKGK